MIISGLDQPIGEHRIGGPKLAEQPFACTQPASCQ